MTASCDGRIQLGVSISYDRSPDRLAMMFRVSIGFVQGNGAAG